MSESGDAELEIAFEPNDKQKLEDKRRRNRESAAKCRERLRNKLNEASKKKMTQEMKNMSLRNEMALLQQELKRVDDEIRYHNRYCNNRNPYCNGANGVKRTHTIVHKVRVPDINNNPVNGNNEELDKSYA